MSFWNNIPEDCKKAISDLKRLKVHRLAAYDNEKNFADVWYLVSNEVLMWDLGNCRAEADADDSDPCFLNRASANAARRWLVKYEHLFIKYADEKDFGSPINFDYRRNPV